MNSVVLTTANSKTTEQHKLTLKLTSPLSLDNNLICFSHCNLYYNWRNFKNEYDNTKLGYVHVPTKTMHTVTLPDGSYSIRDINNYIHFTMQNNKHTNTTGTYDINIYANTVYNRVTAVVGKDYQLIFYNKLLDTLGFEQSQMPISNQEINGNKVPQLERVETVLVHCNLVQNMYQQDSSLIFSFVPTDSFGTLLTIKPNFPQWRETRKAKDIRNIDVWFTDQAYRPLDIEDKILVELQIKQSN